MHRPGRRDAHVDIERRAHVVELALQPVELLARAAPCEELARAAGARLARRRHQHVGGGVLTMAHELFAQVAADRHQLGVVRLAGGAPGARG